MKQMVTPKGKSGRAKSFTMSKSFFDTNIIAYACDQDSPPKQKIARQLLKTASETGNGCISTQVIQEFYVTAVKKLAIAPLQAKRIISSINHLEVGTVTLDDINQAIDGNILWQISFWDALIITMAGKLNCNILYSEDLNHGQTINGVTIHNPFI